MIAVSAWCARVMKREFKTLFQKEHFDIALRRACEDPNNEEKLQPSFVWPAVGNYEEHSSGIIGAVRQGE